MLSLKKRGGEDQLAAEERGGGRTDTLFMGCRILKAVILIADRPVLHKVMRACAGAE